MRRAQDRRSRQARPGNDRAAAVAAPAADQLWRRTKEKRYRNVMLREGKPFFVDYQGGRRGALQYDIASLLYDAKADLPPELRLQLLDHYLDELAGFVDLGRDAFMQHYYAYVYVRIMQALGAYGFRGFYERKVHFLQSVPYALKNLGWLLGHVQVPIALPTLMDAFKSMVASEKLHALASEGEHVTDRALSISFHRGLPSDESGHGGGFVFDARSIPNPGREERFKAFTGKDVAVVDIFYKEGEVRYCVGDALFLVGGMVDK